jgi:hypothetical protein
MTRKAKMVTAGPGMNFLLLDDGDTVLITGAGAIMVDENGDGHATVDEIETLADHCLVKIGRA